MACSSDVTIHSSWRGLLSAAATPALVTALGAYGLFRAGAEPVPLALLVLGLALALVSLLDYPRQARFTPQGVERVCVLRRQRLSWDQIAAVERTPRLLRGRRGGADAPRPSASKGGLVALTTRRRRVLLTDRVEARGEYDRLCALIEQAAPDSVVRAGRPPQDAPPSDLYRRRRPR